MAARSVKDVIAGGKLKSFMDRRLVKAISHPLREHCLAVFNERVASTSDIAREIDLDVPAFYHHVEVLEDIGFLESRVGAGAVRKSTSFAPRRRRFSVIGIGRRFLHP